MHPGGFFAELKGRNVYKVAITYAVVAWLLIQGASILLPTFNASAWMMKAFVVLLALGFALVASISWAFEATPQGLRRTENVPADAFLPAWSRRKFATFIVSVALLEARLREHPGEVRSMRALSWVYLGLNRKEDAIKIVRQALEFLPLDKDAMQ